MLGEASDPGEIEAAVVFQFRVGPQHRHQVVPLPMLDVSATAIRERIAAGEDISKLVPPEVARYIENHGLYRAVPAT